LLSRTASFQGAVAGGVLATATALIVIGMLGAGARDAASDAATRHADAVATQLAQLSVALLVTADTTKLNFLVGRLAEHPATLNVAVYSVDDRLLAGAGRLPPGASTGADAVTSTRPVAFESSLVGHARVAADASAFLREDAVHLRLLSLFVAVAVGALAGWLGGRWLQGTLDAVARGLPALEGDTGANGGVLARLVRHAQAVVAREQAAAEAAGSGFLVVVNLFNQIEFDAADREQAFSDALAAAQGVMAQAGAQVCVLPGTGVLLTLPDPGTADAALRAVGQALATLRAVEAINVQRRRGGRAEVNMRAALGTTPHLPWLFSSVDPVTELGEPLSRAIAESAAVRNGTLCVPHEIIDRLGGTDALAFTAVRAPFAGDGARRFVYQVTAVHAAATAGATTAGATTAGATTAGAATAGAATAGAATAGPAAASTGVAADALPAEPFPLAAAATGPRGTASPAGAGASASVDGGAVAPPR
jgi:uncharacterized membrane protein affecting hemolysin expression